MKHARLIATSLFVLASCHAQPKQDVWAKVTQVYPFASKYQPARVIITFQSGRLIGETTRQAALNRCKVGDVVHAVAQGVALQIGHNECRRT